MIMDEQFIAYLWFNKLFDSSQTTLMGEAVEVVSVGTPNRNAGPDVFNAKVRIGSRLWVGCVEFHVRASDWHRHNHDGNIDYERTILHVVLDADEQIVAANEQPIATIVLSYPAFMFNNYRRLVADKGPCAGGGKYGSRVRVPLLSDICRRSIPSADAIALHGWMDRLLAERLEEKVGIIEQILRQTNNDWETTFYIILCRAMGFGTNSDAMQALAESIPLGVVAHHRNDIEQLEALFLGQAGYLDGIAPQCRTEEVWLREYAFLRNKFNLSPACGPRLKMFRMRPPSFPTMRIAQTAAILHGNDHLLSRLIECRDTGVLRQMLKCRASDYWTTHYTIGNATTRHSSVISDKSIDILIINTVVPFMFLYGRSVADYELQERAAELLRQLPPEHNSITDEYVSAGLECRNAYDSQALLRLSRHYCQRHDCLRCYLGSLSIRKND